MKFLIFFITFIAPFHIVLGKHIFPTLPLEYRQKQLTQIETEVQKRWANVLKIKTSFALYQKKSEEFVKEEFQKLQTLRQSIWYRNPGNSPHIAQEEYMADQRLLEKGLYRTINNFAFAYNCVDGTYNASHILIHGHHFIALMEPLESTHQSFIKLLINHGVSILIRLKPEEEFANKGTINYWKNKLTQNQDITFISLDASLPDWPVVPVLIPYFFTNVWDDDKAMDVKELYRLVQNVRMTYQKFESKGPIAAHCASGVGRTGTFIAAYVLADLLDRQNSDQVSIEEIVLKLSIQRPNLMGTEDQYGLLHKFVDYYSTQKRKYS